MHWAQYQRRPWFHLFLEAVQRFLPPTLLPAPERNRPAPWLTALWARRHAFTLAGSEGRLHLFGPLPSFQENLRTLEGLRRQLATDLHGVMPFEKRYPFLDRDLLEFLFAVPREQLLRPGQRRSLMRRALVGIVPAEILARRRKACVIRTPLTTISTHFSEYVQLSRDMVSASLGIVNPESFRKTLEEARGGQDVAVRPLLRAAAIECWLRGLQAQGILGH